MAWSTKHSLGLLVVIAGLGLPLLLWWHAPPAGAAERPPAWRPEPLQGPPPRKDALLPTPEPPARPDPPLPASLLLEIDPHSLPRTAGPGLVVTLTGPQGRRLSRPLAETHMEWTDLAPGPWRLAVAPGPLGALDRPLWEFQIELKAGEHGQTLLPPLSLAVLEGELELMTAGGDPVPASEPVRLFTQGGWLEARADASGRFRFTGLIPGKALLLVGDGPASGLAGACREVTLAAGETSRVRLAMRRQ